MSCSQGCPVSRVVRCPVLSSVLGGFMRTLVVSTLALLIVAVGIVVAPQAHAADAFTVTTLHFDVAHNSGPRCDVVGDLYVPQGVSPSKRAPAVLTTNGFGGSKDAQAPLARLYASRGYVVLAYSGLGFGGSSCRITFDSPTPDGTAASIGRSSTGSGVDRSRPSSTASPFRPCWCRARRTLCSISKRRWPPTVASRPEVSRRG